MIKPAKPLKGVASLELLDKIFTNIANKTNDAIDIPVLVAIDTESSKIGRISELGISILDPLCLIPSQNDDSDLSNSLIQTYYYAKVGSRRRMNYKPYRLGIPEPRLRDEDLQQILDTHLKPITNEGKLRKVILIGHSIPTDLSLLKKHHNIDLGVTTTNLESILDTLKIAALILRHDLPTTTDPSLKLILQFFKLDYIGLHNAGHDSRYTLRALLMLFIMYNNTKKQQNDSKTQDQNETFKNMLLLMENVARSHKVNERMTWTTSTRKKFGPMPDVFSWDSDEDGDGDADGDEDGEGNGGILALLHVDTAGEI